MQASIPQTENQLHPGSHRQGHAGYRCRVDYQDSVDQQLQQTDIQEWQVTGSGQGAALVRGAFVDVQLFEDSQGAPGEWKMYARVQQGAMYRGGVDER